MENVATAGPSPYLPWERKCGTVKSFDDLPKEPNRGDIYYVDPETGGCHAREQTQCMWNGTEWKMEEVSIGHRGPRGI